MSEITREWESVNFDSENILERLKVDGGYLYKSSTYSIDKFGFESNTSQSMCFVPDIDLQRYQSHLRDAYDQGLKEGQEQTIASLKEKAGEWRKIDQETIDKIIKSRQSEFQP